MDGGGKGGDEGASRQLPFIPKRIHPLGKMNNVKLRREDEHFIGPTLRLSFCEKQERRVLRSIESSTKDRKEGRLGGSSP